jgi:uncharacterized linocin/CFP29 family protein
MSNKYLARGDAPFGDEIWSLLDSAMIDVARTQLAGRRMLGLEGPYGLGLKMIPSADKALESGLIVSEAVPVPMIRSAFDLGVRDLARYEREGAVLDLGPVAEAAAACARLEDDLVFHGAEGVPGLLTAEGSSAVQLSSWEKVGAAAGDIIKAVTSLDEAGFHGPYCLGLAAPRYNLLLRRYPQGNWSELEHLKSMAADGVFKVPALKSGGLLLASGKQFASILMGQDMSIGFVGPAGDRLEFTISESLVPVVRQAAAICALTE